MKSNFRFSNLCGTVYQQGNILFTAGGDEVLSPVGNRVGVFDLVNNKSYTLPFQTRRNIACIALSPDGSILLAVDRTGRGVVSNFRRRGSGRGGVLHHVNFRTKLGKNGGGGVRFSPDGKWIVVVGSKGGDTAVGGAGRGGGGRANVQVWKTPSLFERSLVPFELLRTYTGHFDDVVSVEWAADSSCFITTSKDMTARLFTLHPVEGFRPKTFAGHRDVVVNAYFSADCKTIYTVSRDGALFVWTAKPPDEGEGSDSELPAEEDPSRSPNSIANTRWGISKRHYFSQPNSKVVCTTFHTKSNLLVVGFSTGIFSLYELQPQSINDIHTLSISNSKITSVAINPSGEWLAFGSSKLGQLVVWEWQSESYVLKQQGHYFDMNTLTWSSDGKYVATGGDDAKVKVWNTTSGFCFVTFNEHTAAISSVEFSKQGQILFSASLDGTIRAFDLVRYRNFRTFTSPSPVQFSCLAVEPSGEVIAAGSTDNNFQIFLWSVQTGKLLDILSGHEGPVSGLAFSPSSNVLASGSWDKTVRVWNVFDRSRNVEPFQLNSDVLVVAFRPDGKELAVSTLDGQIAFFDLSQGRQTQLIEGRLDISGGRKREDRRTAKNSPEGKNFNSLAYSADGECIIAGGNSKFVCLYEVRDGVLLRKFEISENLDLDGTEEILDSRRVNEAGVDVDLIDDDGDEEEWDLEERLDVSLPGARRGDLSKRKYRREVRTKCVRFSPLGTAWTAASTEGLLIYTNSDSDSHPNSTTLFDPIDLTIEITPQSILTTLRSQKQYLTALIMSFRLGEMRLVREVYESVPREDVGIVVREVPKVYLERLVRFVAGRVDPGPGSGSGSGPGVPSHPSSATRTGSGTNASPHIEFDLLWIRSILFSHGRFLKERSTEYASALRAVWRALVDVQDGILKICDENTATLSFLIDQSKAKTAVRVQESRGRGEVNEVNGLHRDDSMQIDA